jgi:hypothetical protein
MTLLCRILGHRWHTFNTEDCPAPYRACKRCPAVKHECNEIVWGAKR